jgi:hypothetical protein
MTPEQGQQIFNNLLTAGQAGVSNYFMALNAKEAEERFAKDLSLRERAYNEQKRQYDLSYDFQNRQFDLTSKYQTAQIKTMERAQTDWEAETEAAPYVAAFSSDLRNLYGDPEAIESYNPDISFIDKAPEHLRPRLRAKVMGDLAVLKDKAFADSDEFKETRERGSLLLKGSKYLTQDNGYTPDAFSLSKQLGRKLLRREQLSPEEEALSASLAGKIETEARKRDPALVKEMLKTRSELSLETFRSAQIEFQEASKTLRETLNNVTATKGAKEAAQAEFDIAKENLRMAKRIAGAPVVGRAEAEETKQEEDSTQEPAAPPAGKPETKSPIRNALPPVKYPPLPSMRDSKVRGAGQAVPAAGVSKSLEG